MIWPGVLVRCALLNAMHSNYSKKEKRHISRERFLYLTILGSFLYFWIPGYLWTGLSVFNWVCWITPNDVVVNSLFGTISVLGMGLLTFDWAQITAIGSPLVIPVCFFLIRPRTTQHSPLNVLVVGAAQLAWRLRDRYLVPLSDFMGCVYFCLLAFRPMFTLCHSQECVLLTIYACVRGLGVRQHWSPVQPQRCSR